MVTPVWKEVAGPVLACGHATTRIVGTNDQGDAVDFVQEYEHPDTGQACCHECYADAMERRTAHWTLDTLVRAWGGPLTRTIEFDDEEG